MLAKLSIHNTLILCEQLADKFNVLLVKCKVDQMAIWHTDLAPTTINIYQVFTALTLMLRKTEV
jgi:hypothetical protein